MNWKREILRAPEGAAVGGAPGAPAAAPAPAAPPAPAAAAPGGAPAGDAGKQPPKPNEPPAPAPHAPGAPAPGTLSYRPDGLPDHLAGATEKETIDKLAKAYDGARRAIAEKGEMPADAKAYEFVASDVVKPYAAGLGTDPFMAKVQEAAFKSGIPKGTFNTFLNDVLGEMVAGQMVDAPFDAEKERAALLPDIKDLKERATASDRMASEAIARVQVWQKQGLPEPIAKDLLSRMDRATTIQLTNWIAAGRREQAPAMGGTPSGALTQADLSKRQEDPRNKVGDAKYDPKYAAETTRLYQVLYPNGGDR